MQITYNGKTYKWINDNRGFCRWGFGTIEEVNVEDESVNVWFRNSPYRTPLLKCNTWHTPEQLVKLGYMELIETKPEEKPDHDKAMEIPEVPEYVADKHYIQDGYEQDSFDLQIELLTNSLNAVIKKINNERI